MPNNSPSPLVSILMLTYNRAHFIGEAIASVLAQTYSNFELIIIDDGSTDDTASVVGDFNDSRIKYIKEPTNLGLVVRRRESLAQATGEYVAVLDSDDSWTSKDKLQQQVTFMEEHGDCVVVGTFITLIDETGKEIKRTTYRVTDKEIRNNFLLRNQFAHSSTVMRTALLKTIPGYRFTLSEDLDLFMQLGTIGTLANLPSYLTAYRVHNISESSKKLALIEEVLKIIKLHQSSYPKYMEAWLKYSLYRLWLKLKKAVN